MVGIQRGDLDAHIGENCAGESDSTRPPRRVAGRLEYTLRRARRGDPIDPGPVESRELHAAHRPGHPGARAD